MATQKKPATPKTAPKETPKATPEATPEEAPKKVESFESLVEVPEDVPAAPVIRVKFIETGLTVMSKVWSAGEELEVEVGSPRYESTKDIHGDSWLDLTQTDQESKWGKVFFTTL
jgi:hypothetical protein